MRFRDVVRRLESGLREQLPGAPAHELLAPRPRREWPHGFNPAHIRNAAGLLLIFSRDEGAHVVLTVRSDALGRHSGQVSLPGGVVEPGETFEQTALREAAEEVSLQSNGVRVLGALTPVDIPVSGFRLHPIVAAADAAPSLMPADGEVARIVEVSIADLLDPEIIRTTEVVRSGVAMTVPAFHVNGEEIWGATAMVLAEFLALLGWARATAS